jgi:hypothetical protein
MYLLHDTAVLDSQIFTAAQEILHCHASEMFITVSIRTCTKQSICEIILELNLYCRYIRKYLRYKINFLADYCSFATRTVHWFLYFTKFPIQESAEIMTFSKTVLYIISFPVCRLFLSNKRLCVQKSYWLALCLYGNRQENIWYTVHD